MVWNLSHRCQTEDALAAVKQSVLGRLPEGSRQARVTLTTDNNTQFSLTRFIEALSRLGITHRRTAYRHPKGNSYIERFHRSSKKEEVWTAEYRNVQETRESIGRWIWEYNHDWPRRGVGEIRTPHKTFLSFAAVLKKRDPDCLNRGEQYIYHPRYFPTLPDQAKLPRSGFASCEVMFSVLSVI